MSAYIFAISESWKEYEQDRARQLLDDGLRATQAYRASLRSEPIDLDNVDHRCTYALIGLGGYYALETHGRNVGQAQQNWAPLAEYVKAQPSFERIEVLRKLYGVVGRAIAKDKHYEEFTSAHRAAWATGLTCGLLDIMGEIPAAPLSG